MPKGGTSASRGRWLALVAAFTAFVAPAQSTADVPVANQSLLLLRVLSYDRSVKERAGDVVTVGLVYKPGDSVSEGQCNEISKSLVEATKEFTIASLPSRAVLMPYQNPTAFEAAVRAKHPASVYVCPGLSDALAPIAVVTRRYSVLSMSSVEPFVRAGLGVGILSNGNKARILVNYPVVVAEGTRFEASFLRMAEILR